MIRKTISYNDRHLVGPLTSRENQAQIIHFQLITAKLPQDTQTAAFACHQKSALCSRKTSNSNQLHRLPHAGVKLVRPRFQRDSREGARPQPLGSACILRNDEPECSLPGRRTRFGRPREFRREQEGHTATIPSWLRRFWNGSANACVISRIKSSWSRLSSPVKSRSVEKRCSPRNILRRQVPPLKARWFSNPRSESRCSRNVSAPSFSAIMMSRRPDSAL
jgi:hypothetical protein